MAADPTEPRRRDRGGSREVVGRLVAGLPAVSPAFLVVILLACVLVPLPQVLVDLLLSLSLAGAVLLVVGALRVRRPTQFITFPNLLIMVTLFRIALNLSTTRLILSEADAGRVIDAFATAVVRDDLIVGAVMFLIITTIQYLVIARGTERVAEVGARFALDGMPGRQAAIDADLRSGAISAREASRRRAELDARSSFFGAMDGASRYVRGDAIAGLVIIAINLVGGIAIGTLRAGLSVQDSLALYGRLTIGDGLMAQLPAVLVSLAAGVLVSRVEVDERVQPRWFEPTMLWVPAALLIGVAFVPGMPTAAFGATGVGLLVASAVLERRAAPLPTSRRTHREVGLGLPAAMRVEERRLRRAVVGLRAEVSARTGLECPPIALRFDAPAGALEVRTPDEALARAPLPRAELDAVIVGAYRTIVVHAERLIDASIVEGWIEAVRADHPTVVDDALRAVDRVALIGLVRGLLRERVTLPSPRALLSALAEHPHFGQTDASGQWLARLREVLAPTWVPDLMADMAGSQRQWVRPTPDLELALIASTARAGGRVRCTAAPKRRAEIVAALTGDASGQPTVILTSAAHRERIATWLAGHVPFTPVVSTTELEAAGFDAPAWTWRDETAMDPAAPEAQPAAGGEAASAPDSATSQA